MDRPPPAMLAAAPSGAAMDRLLPPTSRWPRWRRWAVGIGLLALLLAGLAWQHALRRPVVAAPQPAVVQTGEPRDELALRARVEPMNSVQLDAAEAGRVEAVLARDGDLLPAGAPLYRLHSPEQEQLLMQRSAEVAQQAANLAAQRTAQAASLAASRRELAQLQASAQQADADAQRQAALAEAGFVSPAALEQAQRQQRLARQLLEQAQHDMPLEAQIHAQAVAEMSRALQGLQQGLALLGQARQLLLQRAPIAGRLSGFTLQVGASVRPGDRLGRIDDLQGGTQLAAEVDEYYLPRLQPGQAASSPFGPLRLAQVLPQVQAGKVRALLHWADGPAPATLRPGQAVELRLQLNTPSTACNPATSC